MRKLIVMLCAAALWAIVGAGGASALPAFNVEWKARYVEGNKNEAFLKAVDTAKCNVCHDPNSKSKKDHNPYGKAVKKFLTKADYDKMKSDMPAAKKYILEALQKAEAEKAADGKTFGEKIKAGELPGG